MKPRILVLGSSYMEFVMQVTKLPVPGESTVEQVCNFIPGGKGTASAIAFARLGCDSIFCTRLGGDSYGARMKSFLDGEEVDIRFISIDRMSKTGIEVIIDEEEDLPRRIIYPGANTGLGRTDVESAFICYPDAVLLRFDLSPEAVIEATELAKKQAIPVFIDGGPVSSEIPLDQLCNVEVFSPNEEETFAYTGIDPTDMKNCMRACIILQQKINAKYIVLKLGERGSFYYDGKYCKFVSAYNVEALDENCAGDAFTAALTMEYIRSGGDMGRACELGNIVGAITVSKPGRVASIPSYEEVRRFIIENEIKF